MSHLPPLPKLRPRPGLKSGTQNQNQNFSDISIETTQQEDLEEEEEETISPPPMKSQRQTSPISDVVCFAITDDSKNDNSKNGNSKNDSSEKTSRLLTKNDCRGGGGRKRNSGSLIHSIPKFSQAIKK